MERHTDGGQAERARFDEPLLPPIEVYGEVRTILLDAADGMEAVLARYAEVRPWLLAFFYVWITYSALTFVGALYMYRVGTRLRDKIRKRAANEGAISGG